MSMGRDTFLPQSFLVDEKMARIPKFFDNFDNRKPVKMWFDEKLQHVIKSVFDFRMKMERGMKKIELLAFDREISNILTPKCIK